MGSPGGGGAAGHCVAKGGGAFFFLCCGKWRGGKEKRSAPFDAGIAVLKKIGGGRPVRPGPRLTSSAKRSRVQRDDRQ